LAKQLSPSHNTTTLALISHLPRTTSHTMDDINSRRNKEEKRAKKKSRPSLASPALRAEQPIDKSKMDPGYADASLSEEEKRRLAKHLRRADKHAQRMQEMGLDANGEPLDNFCIAKHPVREWKFNIPGSRDQVALNPVVFCLSVVCLWSLAIWSRGTTVHSNVCDCPAGSSLLLKHFYSKPRRITTSTFGLAKQGGIELFLVLSGQQGRCVLFSNLHDVPLWSHSSWARQGQDKGKTRVLQHFVLCHDLCGGCRSRCPGLWCFGTLVPSRKQLLCQCGISFAG
jgi:hypothetical protein